MFSSIPIPLQGKNATQKMALGKVHTVKNAYNLLPYDIHVINWALKFNSWNFSFPFFVYCFKIEIWKLSIVLLGFLLYI